MDGRDPRPAQDQGGAGAVSSEPAGGPHPNLRAALIAALDERAPRVDRDRIAACFDFAARAHGDQKRESGGPYLAHVVAVCQILLELLDTRFDTPLACAALLHDVVEDTPVSIEEVEKRFGREVAGQGVGGAPAARPPPSRPAGAGGRGGRPTQAL